jgi:enamine deaminase RidA (YjgF/YER057c/UK114 family)
VQRTAVNPWPWSLQFGFNQAELVEGHRRTLFCAGQSSVDAEGTSQHPADMAGQLTLTLDNLETVLAGGGMSLADVVRMTIYTTDVDAILPHYGILAERLAGAGVMPAATLLGVARLAFPELMLEIEATAVQ